MKERSNTELRGGTQSAVLGHLGGSLIWCLVHSLEVELRDESGFDFNSGPCIFAVWHDQIIGAPSLMTHAFPGRSNVVLTSASKDGGMLAAAVAVFGMGAARGSSSRRGAAALVNLRKALRAGSDVTITPDGPRGPRRQLQPGVVQLASVSGVPIIPVAIEYDRAWTLRSWDKMQIPKPLSAMTIHFKKALAVPPGLDETEREAWRGHLAAVMPAKD